MSSSIRQNNLISYLQNHQSATIQELADQFFVSHMTIRRDLNNLSQTEPIKIIHGGVIYQENSPGEHYSMTVARSHRIDEKRRIAMKAASLIEPEDIIIIDAGSTSELIAENLPTEHPLTVICYSLNIAAIVSKRSNCTLILAGGIYHESSMIFESQEGLKSYKKKQGKKSFYYSERN